MKITKFAYSTTLFTLGSLAQPRTKSHNAHSISPADMPTRSIVLCPEDHWRPLSPYKSVAFPEPWWFLPDADEANKDHYDVTHPSLPPNIILPNPLMPTNNATVEALYTLAIKAYEEDVIKQRELGHRDCDRWLHALNKFHIMCRCVHMWWWQCSEVGGEGWERTFDKHSYLARYRRLKGMLEGQMRKEGMIDLGKRLTVLILKERNETSVYTYKKSKSTTTTVT